MVVAVQGHNYIGRMKRKTKENNGVREYHMPFLSYLYIASIRHTIPLHHWVIGAQVS